jgi:hypothetical protein
VKAPEPQKKKKKKKKSVKSVHFLAFSRLPELCECHNDQALEYFYHPKKKPQWPAPLPSPGFPPQPSLGGPVPCLLSLRLSCGQLSLMSTLIWADLGPADQVWVQWRCPVTSSLGQTKPCSSRDTVLGKAARTRIVTMREPLPAAQKRPERGTHDSSHTTTLPVLAGPWVRQTSPLPGSLVVKGFRHRSAT